MKKNTIIAASVLSLALVFSTVNQPKADTISPQLGQIVNICELAVTDYYYSNVAKYHQDDAEGMLFWKKDKDFWVEYSGTVRVGVDVSLVDISVNKDVVTITIPEAKVLKSWVDETSLTEESFYVSKNSAKILAGDEQEVFLEAKDYIENVTAEDQTILINAQEKAKRLLSDYVYSIGDAIGVNYTIEWVNIDENGKAI